MVLLPRTTTMGQLLLMATCLIWVMHTIMVQAGYPSEADCGSLRLEEPHMLLRYELHENDVVDITFPPLKDNQGALLTVHTGLAANGRRQQRRNLQGSLDSRLCPRNAGADDDDGDDLIFQPILDDPFGPDQDEGLGDEGDDFDCVYEDDDATPLEGDDLLTSQQQVHVEIKDKYSSSLSEKWPLSVERGVEETNVFVWVRGQQGGCAHPSKVSLVGTKGDGGVEVTSLLVDHKGWNEAAQTFKKAKDVGSPGSKTEWCGNINWIEPRPRSQQGQEPQGKTCTNRDVTPKWKVWLNPKDRIFATVSLYGRSDTDNREATAVTLSVYTKKDLEKPTADIIDTTVRGRRTAQGFFTNKKAKPQWFYLELVHSRRHLYEYGIAFEVTRKCSDKKSGTFVHPDDARTCDDVLQFGFEERNDICTSPDSNAAQFCAFACGCFQCQHFPSTPVYIKRQKCRDLQEDAKTLPTTELQFICNNSEAGERCQETCGKCPPNPE